MQIGTLVDQNVQTAATQVAEVSAAADEHRRMDIFTRPRAIVKICLHGRGAIGLPEDKSYDPAEEQEKYQAQAQARDLNIRLYGGERVDAGYQLMNNEPDVRIGGLLNQLEAMGFRYVEGGWHPRADKTPVNVLTFALVPASEAAQMPEPVRRALAETFRRCAVWLNREYSADGRLWARCDVVNLQGYDHEHRWARTKTNKARNLVIAGEKSGTYAFAPFAEKK